MSEATSAAAAALKAELSKLVEDLAELASKSTGMGAERLDQLKDGFRERIDQLGTEARSTAGRVRQQADEVLEHADSYAHEKPWNLVIAAGLVGLVVGVLVARK
ncbi:MAG: hypothetical protein ABW278_09935 [Steroidobacteraceae bacterium]